MTASPHPVHQATASVAEPASSIGGVPWRLRKHADYQRIYKSGRKQQSSSMTYFAAMRALSGNGPATTARVGLTAGKVLGNAVVRNRIKRRMREAVKANVHLLPTQADVVLHPRRQVLTVDFVELKREVEKIFGMIAARLAQAAPEAAEGPSASTRAADRI